MENNKNNTNFNALSFFFKPKSIIIFGASRKEGKSGTFLLKNIIKYKPKNLILIHPTAEKLYGFKCYKNINDVPNEIKKNIDLAIISIPVQFVADTVIQCIKIGVKGIIIQSGNIGMNNDEVEINKKRIFEALEKYKNDRGEKTRIMGPNSLGVYNNFGFDENGEISNFFTGIMNFKDQPPYNRNGNNLTIVAQTGLVVSGYYIDLFEKKDICISKIIAIGNKLDIDESDILEFLINDPNTKTIAFYLESIKDGRRFFKICKKAIFKFKKNIVLLLSGRSNIGKKAIMSHTNSIASNSLLIDAMCKQLGIIQVFDFSELILAGKLATHIPLPQGNRIGLLSISGAGCVLSADFAEEFYFQIPELNEEIKYKLEEVFPKWAEINHPLDMWAAIEQVGSKAYDVAISAFLNTNKFDVIIFCSIAEERAILNYSNLRELAKNYPKIPLILQIFGGSNDIKNQLTEQFENLNKYNIYIPVVYNLRKVISILSKLVRLAYLQKIYSNISENA
ncbi:MAG: CoA-binding protein [Promethearchaeota archaeon]